MNARANRFAVALAALIAVAGCNTGPRSENRTSTNREPTGAVDRARDAASDGRITTTIQSKYFASPEVKGHQIDVDTKDGVVTLKGKVQNEQAKQQAVQIARGVDGVKNVNDQLEIVSDADRATARRTGEPEGRSPAWITTKVQAQYYVHPGLKPWNIDVTTSDGGVVTLAGEVDSAADRAEAVKIASSTDGVTRVEDRLRVKGEAAATSGAGDSLRETADRAAGAAADAWITARIQSRYFVDDEVKGRTIDVDTSNAVVTLKGTVSSQSERHQAAAIARNTEGVREVHDQLTVAPRTEAPRDVTGTAGRAADRAGRKVSDAWITMKVQAKFFVAPDIKARNIDVDTRSGVVTLNGLVGSGEARETAAQLAGETDGVIRVVNNLKIDASAR